ncbi:hypothetical protein BRARA_J00569 [Brassica rapa]|uniref:P-type ATPase A domain-containing protein n=1 Tax=Brassica campestris TaxID=3711 RepID=A0A397XIH6_BRACM|nr:hypothetical protein BRARA_J00569 [Brassica rapa]
MRGGGTVKISIYNVVVGNVIPLRIGEQVPGDGVLISGQSLAIDESSKTGESQIVHKDEKRCHLTLVTNQREVEDSYVVVV